MKVMKIKKKSLVKSFLLCSVCIGLGYYLHICLSPNYGAMMHANEPPFVSVQGLKTKDVSIKKKFIAEVEAINSVDIVPQVAGYLEEVKFKDGSFVSEGDTLFVIEQSRFKANVDVAEANLEKAKSDFIQIESDYKRQEKLYKDKVVSKSILEKSENSINQAKANIKQAEANLELAKIDLEYTQIKSPINGYIGKALISKGNYVHPQVQSLARIVQVNPIRIAFSVSDKDRITFLQEIKNKQKDFAVEIVYPNGETEEVSVDNIFAESEINPQTATLPVYIDYKNEEHLLVPGNYIDILVRIGNKEEQLVVPLVALAQDINGTYAMVVNGENKVEQRYLKLGKVIEDAQIVLDGLNPDDKVIVQGLQKVQAGSLVRQIEVKE